MRYLLLFLAFLAITNPAFGLEAPSLTITKAGSKAYNFTVDSSDNILGCSVTLRGSDKKKKVAAGKGKTIFSKSLVYQPTVFEALDVPKIRGEGGQGKIKVYFRAELTCGNESAFSSIATRKFKKTGDSASPKFNAWLTQLGDNLSLDLHLIEAFPALEFLRLVDLQDPNDDSGRLFVALQTGEIYSFNNDSSTTTTKLFLDLSAKVTFGGESGLLGLAFHPNFKNNRYFFVHYVNLDGQSIIARYQASIGDPDIADINSELVLLAIDKAANYHHGGQLAFGADGYLYGSVGDGGPQGDPLDRGQKRDELLGSVFRIDVDQSSGSLNYSIPLDNPFVGKSASIRQELYAYGFRNPWRFSFDKVTGDLWLGDVGLGSREEIDLIKKGGNYGWNVWEGTLCLKSGSACTAKKFRKPIHDYDHSVGKSVTGGYVYRHTDIGDLMGRYIFADFVSGRIWALNGAGKKAFATTLIDSELFISSFGEDREGQLYILDYGGKIYKLTE